MSRRQFKECISTGICRADLLRKMNMGHMSYLQPKRLESATHASQKTN